MNQYIEKNMYVSVAWNQPLNDKMVSPRWNFWRTKGLNQKATYLYPWKYWSCQYRHFIFWKRVTSVIRDRATWHIEVKEWGVGRIYTIKVIVHVHLSGNIHKTPPPFLENIFWIRAWNAWDAICQDFFFTSCQADLFASKSATIGCSYFYLYLRSFSPLLKAMYLYMIIPYKENRFHDLFRWQASVIPRSSCI